MQNSCRWNSPLKSPFSPDPFPPKATLTNIPTNQQQHLWISLTSYHGFLWTCKPSTQSLKQPLIYKMSIQPTVTQHLHPSILTLTRLYPHFLSSCTTVPHTCTLFVVSHCVMGVSVCQSASVLSCSPEVTGYKLGDWSDGTGGLNPQSFNPPLRVAEL